MMDAERDDWEHIKPDERPAYSCVILLRSGAPGEPLQLLVEQRPATATVAAGLLTCFGGKREPGETPLATILRECEEELGWTPSDVVRACDLYVDGKLVAWFYLAAAPTPGTPLRFEAGTSGVWISSTSHVGLSPWHRAVLEAWLNGEQRANVFEGE